MQLKRNTNLGITNFIIFLTLFFNISTSDADEVKNKNTNYKVEINVLDKVALKYNT